MSTRWAKTALGAMICLMITMMLGACSNDSISSAARSGVASFINGVFSAAVNEAIGP